jgi:DNA gyrase/topoisomerase IV subunit B
MSGQYTAKDISVLEGLDAVRKRPGMYIGGTGLDGLHHLLWEIVDNAVDEAMNGHASVINVTLEESGDTIVVEDNGRGIPVDEHPKEKRSALEVIFTVLHAGGKFGNDAYKTAGGLHGVGASVVNALSLNLEARVKRDGQEWRQEFRRGKPKGPVEAVGAARGTGTKIRFTPDPEIFEDRQFDPALILQRLEIRTFLHKGLRIVFKDRVSGTTTELLHEGGLADYLTAMIVREGDSRCIDTSFLLDKEIGNNRVDLALGWTSSPRERLLSYVNGIPTRDGGTHEQGLREAIVKALRGFMDTHGLTPRGVQLTAEDLREGLVGVISMMVPEPQFQGQTKDRLNNPEVRGIVDGSVRQALEQWLHDNKSRGEQLVQRAVQAAKARLAAREAATVARRKTPVSGRLNLPGKLADCSSTDTEQSELFIVEGDSAGGSAKQGRDRKTQAVLPVRGKVLNAEQASAQKVAANKELNNIVTALGCGMGPDFRAERLRYGRVVLLMDADTDGHHITTLMLAFFYRHLRPLLEEGVVHIAQPPLFRVNIGKETHWALDEAHRDRIISEHGSRAKPEITRFKGLGEMPPATLFETTLDPSRRRLLRVTIPEAELAEEAMSYLLGDDPQARFRLIMEHARSVDELDV